MKIPKQMPVLKMLLNRSKELGGSSGSSDCWSRGSVNGPHDQYRGIVDEINDGIAYITLIAGDGKVFNCTKDASKILGMQVGQSFWFSLESGIVPVPLREVTQKEIEEMGAFFDNAFGFNR